LIVGVQGTGKTKMLIDLVNNAAETSDGCVVCIEKGEKLRFDIKHEVRLTNTADYDISTAESLYGLVCGLYAENYDITHVFIDSALKICNKDPDEFSDFVKRVDAISDKCRFKCVMTASVEKDDLPEDIKKYVV
jgi:tetrahydromethanopterin S-methyltransferase subunit G